MDRLEDRRLFAIVPLGTDFQLNSYSTDIPQFSVLATEAKCNSVSVWESPGLDGRYGIRAQRYNARGQAIGAEFQVNVLSSETTMLPKVAIGSRGSFIVTWRLLEQDGGTSIRARRFTSAGVAQGGEIIVASSSEMNLTDPTVAVNAKGQFVVTWSGLDDNGTGVFARQYSAKGVATKGGFGVNTYTSGEQTHSAVAVDQRGQAIITWQSADQDGSGQGVFAQRFAATGSAIGAEFRVNANRRGNQLLPAVSVNSKGTFLIAWTTDQQDGDGYGIVARKFLTNGSSREAEFLVNTTTGGSQISPSIAASRKGDFLVAWTSLGQDGSFAATAARRYDATGKAKGAEFNAPTVEGLNLSAKKFALAGNGTIESILSSYSGIGGVQIRVTYTGDLNLDGVVDIRDLYQLAQNWLPTGTVSAGSGLAVQGTFRLTTSYISHGAVVGGTRMDVPLVVTSNDVINPGSVVSLTTGRLTLTGETPLYLIETDGTLNGSATVSTLPVSSLVNLERFVPATYTFLDYGAEPSPSELNLLPLNPTP